MTAEIKIRDLVRSPYYESAKIAAACIGGIIVLVLLGFIKHNF